MEITTDIDKEVDKVLKIATDILSTKIILISLNALNEIQATEMAKPNGMQSDAFKIASKAVSEIMQLGEK